MHEDEKGTMPKRTKKLVEELDHACRGCEGRELLYIHLTGYLIVCLRVNLCMPFSFLNVGYCNS